MTAGTTRRSLLVAGLACLGGARRARARAPGQVSPLPYRGVNLAGAEFGTVPGLHGRDYLYPTRENIDYYRGLGFDTVRLPFKWERLQPRPSGELAGDELERLSVAVRHATGQGVAVILDPHNYARRRLPDDAWGHEHLVGSDAVSVSAFADLWRRLALLHAGDERVIFGLMNEPAGLEPAAWLEAANAALGAIRGAGASNLVLVPGVAYTGAHSWFEAGNTAMAGIRDPGRHFALDVHQYLDADSSGTSPEAVSGSIGAERIEGFQEWAREHGFKAFLGEFGGAHDPTSLAALHDLLLELEANPDVWLGWTAWAGGPRWPVEDMFNLEPYPDGRVREQTRLLAAHARPRSPLDWAAPGAALDLDLARGRLVGADALASVLRVSRASPGLAETRGGRLLAFAADAPRLTDRGLLVEEERENLLGAASRIAVPPWTVSGQVAPRPGASPDGTDALILAPGPGPGWCALGREVALPALTLSFSVHARDRGGGWLALRGDHPSSRHAAFDLGTGRPGSASAEGSAVAGRRGAWQRMSLTWTPERAAQGQVLAALNGRDGNAAPYPGGEGAVELWGAQLEAGLFPTSFTPGRRHQDVVAVTGPLLALLQAPAVTLVVETRDLPSAPVACEILGHGGAGPARPLLRRDAEGALGTAHGAPLRTRPQPPGQWRMRRRSALSFDRGSGRVALAVTGGGAASARAESLPAITDVRLGGLGEAALNGRVTRITAYAGFREADTLAALVV